MKSSNSLFLTTTSLILAALLNLMPEANADKSIVYLTAFTAGNDGAIHTCLLDSATGQLEKVHTNQDAEHPFFLALSPDNKHLYSIYAESFGGADNSVAAYEVVDATGKLKLLNQQSAKGTAACYLDVDATGHAVLLSNYGTGSIVSYGVRKDGSLKEMATFVQHAGVAANGKALKPHAHCSVVSPDNRFVLAADLGLDQVLSYRLNSETAELKANDPPFTKTKLKDGPRHLTFHPNGKHVYVINEYANSVTTFDYDTKSGGLSQTHVISTVPEDFAGTSYCADVKATPDGRFLYGTNRGHDTIACYKISADGTPSLITYEPSLGKGPQNLAITADGKLLLCANMPGNNVAVFRIDPDDGKLTSVGTPFETKMPSCLLMP